MRAQLLNGIAMDLLPRIVLIEDGFLCDIHRVQQLSPLITEKMLTSARQMARDELLELLMSLGFHERDILDAFAAARGESVDPESEQGKLLRKAQAMLGHPEAWRS